jgi:hypothetical protein
MLSDPSGMMTTCNTVKNSTDEQSASSDSDDSGMLPNEEMDPPPPQICGRGGGGGGVWLDWGFAGDDSGMGMEFPIGGGDLASQIALMSPTLSWGITSWDVICGMGSCNELPNYGWIAGVPIGIGLDFPPPPESPKESGNSSGPSAGAPSYNPGIPQSMLKGIEYRLRYAVGSLVKQGACGKTPQDAMLKSVKSGAVRGTVRGAIVGFGGGEFMGGIGGIPGSILGGFMGGTFGAAGGVIWGGGRAAACSIAGTYD